MGLVNQVSVLTTAVNAEFMTAYEATQVPAQYLKYTSVIPANGRYTNLPFLSPTPGVHEYLGHRHLAKIQAYLYSITMKEYSNEFECELRDLQDDQTGGLMLKSAELAQKMKLWPGRAVLNQIATGKSTPCFDGSNFFATSHTFGSGNNALTATSTNTSDGAVNNIICLVTTNKVKPLIWLNRKDPDIENNMDTKDSKFNKKVAFWSDMEGAPAFGRWHDAILFTITNTPSVTDIQTYLGTIENQIRTFALPTALPGDPLEYIHEQLVFSPDTVTFLVSTPLGNLFRQVLHQDTIIQSGGPVTNIYKGFGDLVVSALVNTVT